MREDDVAYQTRAAELCLRECDLVGACRALTSAWQGLDDQWGLWAARIRKLEGNLAVVLGAYDEAEEAYRHSLEILAAMDCSLSDVRSEVVRCESDQGQLDLRRGRLTSAWIHLRRVLSLQSVGEEADRARLLLALVHLVRPGGNKYACQLVDQVASRSSGSPLSELTVRVHEVRGLLLAALSKYDESLCEFEVVDRLVRQRADALMLARNQQNRASVLLAKGEPGAAQEELRRALSFYGRHASHESCGRHKSHDFRAAEAVARTGEGMVKLALGAWEDAARLFAAVDEQYEESGDFDPREKARNLDGWGSANQLTARSTGAFSRLGVGSDEFDPYKRVRNLEIAAARHSAALALLNTVDAQEKHDGWNGEPWTQADRVRFLTHLATDHLMTYRVRYVRRAKALMMEADGLLSGSVSTDVEVARCRTNLGVACALLGDFDDAEVWFRQASKSFDQRGTLLEQLAANHNLGCVLARSTSDGERLKEALELLVPAALVRDSVRFDLPSSSQRSQWWGRQAVASISEALSAARDAMNAQLVADLILAFRLPGPMELGDLEDRPSVWITPPPSEPAALDPDTAVVLARGPRICTPTGRVVLKDYLELAGTQYHVEVRTGSMVAIAGTMPQSVVVPIV
jgi:tetratricopeptide (TPR) repeat protein